MDFRQEDKTKVEAGKDPFEHSVKRNSCEFRDHTAFTMSFLYVYVFMHSLNKDKGALYSVWKTLAGTFPPTVAGLPGAGPHTNESSPPLPRMNLGIRRTPVSESV